MKSITTFNVGGRSAVCCLLPAGMQTSLTTAMVVAYLEIIVGPGGIVALQYQGSDEVITHVEDPVLLSILALQLFLMN
ncbi:hypothetical protein SAMN06269173_11012 [Hymenobacter mucosus]|uniref:Uncharacterized protein n=2 Tax=Hymenobacter mucosus TaxID=1411120 RepID=A0A238ZW28_9BACT|nr:hypothetical protein SAMN06269173_11012 [Hymenobacter mucosus]